MNGNRKPAFGWAPIVLALAALVIHGGAGLARADEGGLKDSTGLVWSRGDWAWSSYPWRAADQMAEQYVVKESGVVYDDWRLPTTDELLLAIGDGTLAELFGRSVEIEVLDAGAFWSGEIFKHEGRWMAYYVGLTRLGARLGSGSITDALAYVLAVRGRPSQIFSSPPTTVVPGSPIRVLATF